MAVSTGSGRFLVVAEYRCGLVDRAKVRGDLRVPGIGRPSLRLLTGAPTRPFCEQQVQERPVAVPQLFKAQGELRVVREIVRVHSHSVRDLDDLAAPVT